MATQKPVSVDAIEEFWDAKWDELIKKSLIQGNAMLKLQRKWSITELRVFSILLVHVKPHCTRSGVWDEEFRTVFIPIGRIVELFSMGQRNRPHMERIADSVDKMTSTSIGIRANAKRHISIPVFEIIDLDMNSGLTAKFSKHMRRYILDLQEKRWTKSPFNEVFQLSRAYAVFLIQWLHSAEPLPLGTVDEWYAEISLDDLRERLGATSKTYERVDKVQQKIIIPAIEEINARLLFNVTYKPLRQEYKSHRITGFLFHIKKVQVVDVPNEEDASRKRPPRLDDVEPTTGMTYSELEALIAEHNKAVRAEMDEALSDDLNITQDVTTSDELREEKQDDPTAKYLSYVTLPREQNGSWGVSSRIAKKFVKALGLERCKLISDSMIPSLEAGKLDIPAAALVSAWKANKLYESHGVPVVNIDTDEPKEKPQAAKEKPIDMSNFFRP